MVEDTATIDWDSLTRTHEWRLACRIAASKRLSKSELLPKFLLYICEQSLIGNADRITEQHIGTHIFNRPTDYNPGEDNIVRSYARLLRKRLDEYFESEGKQETIRIVIPRGGYVPIFKAKTEEDPAEPGAPPVAAHEAPKLNHLSTKPILPPADIAEHTQTVSSPVLRLPWVLVLIGLLLGFALASIAWWAIHAREEKTSQESAHPIWAEVFQANKDTLIVPADSGLGILQNLSGILIPLETYASRSYFSGDTPVPGINAANLDDLREQRYTSVVDLNIVARLMQLPELAASRTEIRYARSVTAEDLKNSNVILLGSSHTNPWVSLFEDRLNFKLKYTPTVDQSFVLNERPLGSEQKQYLNGTSQTDNRTYGVIDYLPNLDRNGHVLIIQGLNMAATQAAADALFNSKDIKAILNQAMLPNGSLKSFELLIQTSSIGATDPGSQIIATRFYQ